MTTTGKKLLSRKSTSRRIGTTPKTATQEASVSKKVASGPQTVSAAAPKKMDSAPFASGHEERWHMISVAAYHKAEQRDFMPGHELTDWLGAEKEILTALQSG